MKVKMQTVFEVNAVLKICQNVKAAKLAYALARNAPRVQDAIKPIREQLKGSDAFQKFTKRKIAILDATGKTQAEKDSEIEALEIECSVQDESKELEVLEKELLEMEVEMNWYKIPLKIIPGMKDDDDLEAGILPLGALQVLIAAGIIDDSEVITNGSKSE